MYSPVGESATGGFPSRVLRVAQGVRGGVELTQKPPSMPACRSFAFTSPHLCTCLPFPGYPSLPSHAPCHSDPPKSPENSIQRHTPPFHIHEQITVRKAPYWAHLKKKIITSWPAAVASQKAHTKYKEARTSPHDILGEASLFVISSWAFLKWASFRSLFSPGD